MSQMVNARGNHSRDMMVDIRLLPTFSQAMQMIESCGIELIQKEFEITVNTRAKRQGGVCRIRQDKIYIEISEWVLTKVTKEGVLLNFMTHELLHAVEGCHNHGTKWKSMAFRINHKYDMNIRRIFRSDEIGIEEFVEERTKYVCRCEICGYEIKRQRASNFTKNPHLYKHPRCGGKFELIHVALVA